MTAIHIPKSGKASSLHDLICHKCLLNVKQAQRLCVTMGSVVTQRQTATESIPMDLMVTAWSHLFFSKNCLAFPCFHCWPWLWSSCLLCHLKLNKHIVQKVQGDFTGKRHFFVHNLNISYAWLPLCACHSEKLPNSKLNKLILALLKKKLCQNCSMQRNPNHKTILIT